jgi:DNA topoisomerase-6 subunit B
MAKKKTTKALTAEQLAQRQRDISVSEFFLKNRHLLGFDNPRKALMTTVKEAVDNSLDACEEAAILPEISVDITQTDTSRFRVEVTDNGPGVVPAQIPRIFAKLLYGSKFHRLRMLRGQQGIGISAAGMYGQLTTGSSTRIVSRVRRSKNAREVEVQIDTRKNAPTILKDVESDWHPVFYTSAPDGKRQPKPLEARHGTSVSIDMEASYVRGRLSVDEYLKQCAVVNPHLRMHYRVTLRRPAAEDENDGKKTEGKDPAAGWSTYERVVNNVPPQPREIKPHPHGVELGLLMQMLKDTKSRTLKSALQQDFSRVSARVATEICEKAGLNTSARPTRIAHQESEALYKAIGETRLMRPPTDCLTPIGEEQLISGLKKEIEADFYTAVTRPPTVYRGNPFQVEVALTCSDPRRVDEMHAADPVRLMRFANRVPLLYMTGACAITKAVTGVKWKTYGISQPHGSLPLGPIVIAVHLASVWVPFTSESKEAIAHYPEILTEIARGVQECGRRLSVFLNRRKRRAEAERKRNYMLLYIPHLALGLKQVLDLSDREEARVVKKLHRLLERTHLDV